MFRKIARPMLASVYVAEGVDTVLHADDHVKDGTIIIERTRSLLPTDYARKIPDDPKLVIRAVGGTKIAAGSLLALGKFQRLSAAALAITTVPTLVARYAFWETQDEEEKSKRKNGFLTHLGLLGGLLITASDTKGKPDLRWRTKHAAKVTGKKVEKALPGKSETEKYLEAGKEKATDLAGGAKGLAAAGAATATDFWDGKGKDFLETASAKAQEWFDNAQEYVEDNKDDWLAFAESNTKAAKDRAVKAARKAQKRAEEATKKASDDYAGYSKRAAKASKKATKKATKARKKAIKRLQKKFDY